MIDYFYPELGNGKDENPQKKFVNELLNPEQAYFEALRKAESMKKPQTEMVNKNTDKLLTNDGREMLNENK